MVSFENDKRKVRSFENEEYKDHLLTFEELGVDFLFVDEAHAYKTFIRIQNVQCRCKYVK